MALGAFCLYSIGNGNRRCLFSRGIKGYNHLCNSYFTDNFLHL